MADEKYEQIMLRLLVLVVYAVCTWKLNKGDTEHPSGKIGCSGAEENDKYGFDGHVNDICCDPTC